MYEGIKKLGREPLLHFLVIGVVIFLVYDLKRDIASEAPDRILVTKGQQEQLVANFKRSWLRPPSDEELAGLVENYVREEVFYREAKAMGLDQNDALVRQRMRMKLEFMLEDLSSHQVTDAELAAFMQKHPDRFRSNAQISFQQVYLNPDKHKDLNTDALKLLAGLNEGMAPDSMGDPTLAPYEYQLVTQDEIARSLGEQFAKQSISLMPGNWTGPVYSVYGAHLLKVSERIEAHLPELSDIRKQVEREFLVTRRQELKILTYNKLRAGYQVIVESLDIAAGSENGLITTVQAGEIQ